MTDNRPYKVHQTDGADATRALMEWLKNVGAGGADPVGVAVRDGTVALSQAEDMYVIASEQEGFYARAALAAALMGASPPRLVAVHAEQTLGRLAGLLGADGHYDTHDFFGRLAQCMVGDLWGCARTIDQMPPRLDLPVTDEAYTARLLEPQYQWETSSYYTAVTLPLARLRAEYFVFGGDGAATDWWVSYPHLWISVLAYSRYTGDPTLTWLLQEGREPLEALAQLFEYSPAKTTAVLAWHICGRSVDVMKDTTPALMEALPDDLPAVGDEWNKKLPSLWLGISNIMQAYQQERIARTLYGRKLQGGRHPGAASAHVILGTVQDILDVAAVSFWNNRPDPTVMIKLVNDDPTALVNQVVGVGPAAMEEREAWIQNLRALAPLAAPLGQISLAPTVVTPPGESPPLPAAPASEAPTSSSSGAPDTSPTTGSRKRAGSTSTGTTRKPRKATRTKPKGSGAAPKRSRATAAAPTSASSPRSRRAKSSKSRTSSN